VRVVSGPYARVLVGGVRAVCVCVCWWLVCSGSMVGHRASPAWCRRSILAPLSGSISALRHVWLLQYTVLCWDVAGRVGLGAGAWCKVVPDMWPGLEVICCLWAVSCWGRLSQGLRLNLEPYLRLYLKPYPYLMPFSKAPGMAHPLLVASPHTLNISQHGGPVRRLASRPRFSLLYESRCVERHPRGPGRLRGCQLRDRRVEPHQCPVLIRALRA